MAQREKLTIWAAPGRNVRHPHTKVQLPAEGLTIFADDPYWYRRIQEGDVVTVDPAPAPAPATKPAPAAPVTAQPAVAPAPVKE